MMPLKASQNCLNSFQFSNFPYPSSRYVWCNIQRNAIKSILHLPVNRTNPYQCTKQINNPLTHLQYQKEGSRFRRALKQTQSQHLLNFHSPFLFPIFVHVKISAESLIRDSFNKILFTPTPVLLS